MSAFLRRDWLFDRLDRFVDERIDVGEGLALLTELDLLKLDAPDLLLTHADEAPIHAHIRRFGAMTSQQHANRFGEPDGFDSCGESGELRLDRCNSGFCARKLLADVLDLIAEPAFSGPDGRQGRVTLIELGKRLVEAIGHGLQLVQQLLRRFVLALDLEPVDLLLGLTELLAQGFVVSDS